MRSANPPRPRSAALLASLVSTTLACAEASHDSTSATGVATAEPAGPAAPSAAGAGGGQHEGSGGASAATQRSSTAGWPADLEARLGAGPPGDRIYSKVRFLWIRPEPAPTQRWLGYLSLGDSVRVRGGHAAAARVAEAPRPDERCQAWYAVDPRGFVCVGEDATLDPNDPVASALGSTAANPRSPWPYAYAESLGTPIYRHLPSESEQRQSEPDLATHLDRVRLASADTSPAEPATTPVRVGAPTGEPASPPRLVELSPYGRGLRTRVWPGSTIAYTRTFEMGGRSWLLTWDRGIVPRDRVRPYPRTQFSGVALTAARRLPIAFFRQRPRPKYRMSSRGRVEKTDEQWSRLDWVGLTGRNITVGERAYLETDDDGHYCAQDDATVVERAITVPPRIAGRSSGRRTWLDISVLGGWLVAYEGTEPVYATLISPGRGGVPFRGIPPIDTASTPVGQFTVTGKFVTATMASTSDANLVHAEVQYTQNFSGPHALHGAYWHDDWGEKKSGGCVNLSPIDSRRLFAWTDPPLPADWHGVRWVPGQGESTVVLIHR